jgi:hypothetical protein
MSVNIAAGSAGLVPSPSDVRRRREHEFWKARRRSNVLLERGEIVQVTYDRRIVVGSRAIPRADAPGERAKFIGRRLDEINAWE